MILENTDTLKIEKFLECSRSSDNWIAITKINRRNSTMEVEIRSTELEVSCCDEFGTEVINIPLDLLKKLIAELEESNKI